MARRTLRKQDNIEKMKNLYAQRGYSDIEMAELLGIDRTTVHRTRRFMEEQMGLPFYQEDDGRHRLDPQRLLSNLQVTPAEALALYLGGRRLQQQTRTNQVDVANALYKLSQTLRRPLMGQLVRAAEVILEQEQDHEQRSVMETLLRGWLEGYRVRIRHRKLHGELRTYTVSPYVLEPAVWGDGVYLIGHSDYHEGLATFKVARIVEAHLLPEPYFIPEDFDVHALLQHAWGIWHADGAPQVVHLRFSRAVAPRVKESIWHPSQTIRDLDNGDCEWRAEVAEWREMVPWIRGWGTDVEVLEPEALQELTARTTFQGKAAYEKSAPPLPPHLIPYAKTERGGGQRVHRLLYHLIDVGHVALMLWQEAISQAARRHVAAFLGLGEEEAGRFVAFIAALHDLGKAGPAYQDKYAPSTLRQDLERASLLRRGYGLKTMQAYHGVVTTWALADKGLLITGLGLQPRFATKVAQAAGGHHGVWPGAGAWSELDDDKEWDGVRADLFWELKALFSPPAATPKPDKTALNAFLVWISGFISVADWVGSIEDYFPLEDGYLHTRRYAQRARQQAQTALKELGWLGWQPRKELLAFQEMFPFPARPLQQAVIEAGMSLAPPALLILEAPTGIGKTEAALYLADTWLQASGVRGLYVAMPTQATSNQMFGRTRRFLETRYPNDLVNLHLLHGQALWSEAMQEITLHTVGEDNEGTVAAMSWFDRQRKRTLLAPFGVGTVDQALLSILQTRHFFVRLFGLGHKVVLFDEVHAYDTYMNELFYRLLAWLRALNVSVIILSATLPAATRNRLIEAYTGQPAPDERSPAGYPAVTVAGSDRPPKFIALPAPPPFQLGITWCERNEVVSWLREELVEGGCAVVICNTVRRAQEVYQSLSDAEIVSPDNLILFHARFPPVWRQEIEASVLARFGPPMGNEPDRVRPYRAIVVATQVVEQSLDLDFDVMVSDHAPIDLLLQRAGRLHRHDRGPRRHARRLVLVRPEMNGSLPHFTPADVYEPHVLLRSFAALLGRDHVVLPADTPLLIEAVYGPLEEAFSPDQIWHQALVSSYTEMTNEQREVASRAAQALVREPGDARLLTLSIAGLEEDDPTVHATFRAQTRDIDPGVTLVCLHKHGDRVTLDPDPQGSSVALETAPDRDLARALLQRAVTVHQRDVIRHFLEAPVPAGWREHGALRYTRAAVFEGGICQLPGTNITLTLSRELGLGVHKEVA